MKKYISYIFILVILFQTFLLYRLSVYEKYKYDETVPMQNNDWYKKCIMTTIQNDGYSLKTLEIASDNDHLNLINSFEESLLLPCMIVYIPYSDETCMSCVYFFINKVLSFFENTELEQNIYILSSEYNPNLKSRVFGKPIYYLTEKGGLGIPADNEKIPHYFILKRNCETSMFFTPDVEEPGFIDIYLKNVSRYIKNEMN